MIRELEVTINHQIKKILMPDSIVYVLSKRFSLRVIKLYQFLNGEKHEYVISRQILRSATSIGANIAESKFAQSQADYLSKIRIALKEANETLYWLELLCESGYIEQYLFDSLANDVRTIIGTSVNNINKIEKRNRSL